jgi:hypothetical protein
VNSAPFDYNIIIGAGAGGMTITGTVKTNIAGSHTYQVKARKVQGGETNVPNNPNPLGAAGVTDYDGTATVSGPDTYTITVSQPGDYWIYASTDGMPWMTATDKHADPVMVNIISGTVTRNIVIP